MARVALWGPLLDRLNVVGECYRALVGTQLAGGDFLSDQGLLADGGDRRVARGAAVPSVATQSRFCDGAELDRTDGHHRPGRHPGGDLRVGQAGQHL